MAVPMSSLLVRLDHLISELKRRHVLRVAVAYAVVAWLVIQVAATTFPILELPAWAARLVLALVVLGFPLALVLAWAFEVTPEGVRRTQAASPEDAAPRRAWSRAGSVAVAAVLVVLAAIGGYAAVRGAGGGGARGEASVAVLPFVNGSAERENEYFSDGVTDDVITRLSRIDGLTVISHAAAMRYKGTQKPLPQVARELGAGTLLTGRVQRVGSRVRISAELVDPRTGRELWRESYDREMNDIFAMQGDIAQEIAQTLELRLTTSERRRLARNATDDVEAFDAYLRAREYLMRRAVSTAEARSNVLIAVTLLRQALERDPEYARAYAGLAWAYTQHPDLSLPQTRDSSVRYARRALQMDPELPEGHLELGYLYLAQGEREAARQQFERALRLSPSHADAVSAMADYYRDIGRFDEAVRHLKRAIVVEPGAGARYQGLSGFYGALGDFDQEERWLRRSFEIEPDPAAMHCAFADLELLHRRNPTAAGEHVREMLRIDPQGQLSAYCAGRWEVYRGNFAAARAHFERYGTLQNPDRLPWRELGYLALQTGDTARADSLLRLAEERERRRLREEQEIFPNGHSELAIILSLRGKTEEALQLTQEAIARGWRGYYLYNVEGSPYLERLRAQPRFRQMMAEVKAELDRQRERVQREGI